MVYTHAFDAVAVIQSLRPFDDKTGTKLMQNVVAPECAKIPIPAWFYDVATKAELLDALANIESRTKAGNHSPVIHIEAHGDESGLQTTSYETIGWDELRHPFESINVLSRLNLLVTLASCFGGYLARALLPIHRAPVWGLVGPKQSEDGPILLRDYSTFYTELVMTRNGRAALEKLNGGPPSPAWRYSFIPAEYMFKMTYRKYLETEGTEEAINRRAQANTRQAALLNPVVAANYAYFLADAKRLLRDHRSFFDRYRKKFFMVDLVPENDTRFTVSYEDVKP
jgi:hypothetical protein